MQISDPDYDNYNGELHGVIHIGAKYDNPLIGFSSLGTVVVVREPWLGAPGFCVQPVSEIGSGVAVYRAAAANFDSKWPVPPDYN
jgi:hypothetical protein